jgi:predicted site-specific integrase-resolvase
MSVARATTLDQVPARDPILVDEAEASRLCGVSKPTFRGWSSAGLIAKVTLPGDIRRNLYRLSDIQRLADQFAREQS